MNGFFLGGMAEGGLAAQKQALAERAQTEETGLRTRGLELQERQFNNTMAQQAQVQADQQIAQTMAVVAETVKNATAVGRPPEQIAKAVAPLVRSAQQIAQRVGRDPAMLASQVEALITNPSMVETASATGTASAATKVAEAAAIQKAEGQTGGVQINPYKTEAERTTAENALRDDYTKQSKEFTVVRDFYDRMKTAPTTGAGDLALVFSFMKMLDPGSTVREGEYANAQNAAGVPEGIRGIVNNLVGGGKLGPEARKQIKDAAAQVWTTASGRHLAMTNQFANIAKRQRLRPENVIVDYNEGAPAAAASVNIPEPPKGFNRVP